jgi:hypothetical protein
MKRRNFSQIKEREKIAEGYYYIKQLSPRSIDFLKYQQFVAQRINSIESQITRVKPAACFCEPPQRTRFFIRLKAAVGAGHI